MRLCFAKSTAIDCTIFSEIFEICALRRLKSSKCVAGCTCARSVVRQKTETFFPRPRHLNCTHVSRSFQFQTPLPLKTCSMGPLIVGVDAGHNPNTKDNAVSLIVKPVDRMQRWRRLRLDSSGDITVRSRKLRWWVFTLDLQGTVNPLRRTSDASFRLATKWDLARGQYHNKRRVNLGEATEGRVHWGVNYNLPEVAGSFGASRREVDRGMHAEVGYAHADVAKVELVVWPLRNNPKWEGTGRYLGVREDVDVVEELVGRSGNGGKADGGGAETHGRDVLLPPSGGDLDGAAKMAVHTRADARWKELHAHVRHLRSHFKLPNSQKN
jgi:hypothetical protein